MEAIRLVQAPNPGPFTLEGTNTWVVGTGPLVVIDPGPDDPAHREAILEAVGHAQILAVLVTHHHADHAAGAPALAAAVGAPVLALGDGPAGSALAEETARVAGDVRLVAVPTPGHSPDHVAFHHPDSGVMFTGDAVLGRGTSVIAPPEGDMAAYVRSLQRMLALGPTALYPGHGPVVRAGERKIVEYLEHRRRREQQVLEALGDGARAAAELVPAIYSDHPAELHPAAARSVLAHLLKLEREGRVRRSSGPSGDRFELLEG